MFLRKDIDLSKKGIDEAVINGIVDKTSKLITIDGDGMMLYFALSHYAVAFTLQEEERVDIFVIWEIVRHLSCTNESQQVFCAAHLSPFWSAQITCCLSPFKKNKCKKRRVNLVLLALRDAQEYS